MTSYVRSTYRTAAANGEQFERDLAAAIRAEGWTAEDFGGEYAWDAAVPAPEQAEAAIAEFIANQRAEWAGK